LPEVLNRAQAMARDDGVKPLAIPGNPTGRNPHSESKEETCYKHNSSHGSTNAAYLVRRLKRDAPEIADALGRGEYPSAQAAGPD
jgi:hypothetical protein